MRRRHLIALLLAVLGTLGLETTLGWREARRERDQQRLRALLDEDQRAFLRRASTLQLEAGGTRLRLTASPEGWICPELLGVPADPFRLNALFDGLIQAEGRRCTQPADPAAGFGLGDSAQLRLRLAASWREPVELEIGRSLPAIGGCYARRRGDAEVLQLDSDLVALLGPEGPLGLVDRSLSTRAWPPAGQRVVALEVLPQGAPAFQLQLRARTRPPGPGEGPATPFEWVLASPTERTVLSPRAEAYVRHLSSLRWIAVLDPESAPPESPPARALGSLRWTASGGSALELSLSTAEPGLIIVEVPVHQRRYLVPATDVQAVLPPLDLLCTPELDVPWPASELR